MSEIVSNKASQRLAPLLLSSTTLLFKYLHFQSRYPTVSSNWQIYCTLTYHSLAAIFLSLKIDRDRKDAITSNQNKKGTLKRVSIIPSGLERREGVYIVWQNCTYFTYVRTLHANSISYIPWASLCIIWKTLFKHIHFAFNDREIRNSIISMLSSWSRDSYGNQPLLCATFCSGEVIIEYCWPLALCSVVSV